MCDQQWGCFAAPHMNWAALLWDGNCYHCCNYLIHLVIIQCSVMWSGHRLSWDPKTFRAECCSDLMGFSGPWPTSSSANSLMSIREERTIKRKVEMLSCHHQTGHWTRVRLWHLTSNLNVSLVHLKWTAHSNKCHQSMSHSTLGAKE